MNTDLIEYYRLRAAELEAVYRKPERQTDLARLGQAVGELARNADVLEIACGTGYWTRIAAATARSITATDINGAMLDVARTKHYDCPVTLLQADLYQLPPDRPFDLLLGAFIWSHIPIQNLPDTLTLLLRHLRPGGRAVFFDNRYVAGSSTPVCRRDEHGNSFQLRTLDDGTTHEVLKNFPDRTQFLQAVPPANTVHWTALPYYWLAAIDTPA